MPPAASPQGNYSWTQDVRIAYFNKNAVSPYNNKKGKWISIEGNRFGVGQFPKLNQPPAPPPEGRK